MNYVMPHPAGSETRGGRAGRAVGGPKGGRRKGAQRENGSVPRALVRGASEEEADRELEVEHHQTGNKQSDLAHERHVSRLYSQSLTENALSQQSFGCPVIRAIRQKNTRMHTLKLCMRPSEVY